MKKIAFIVGLIVVLLICGFASASVDDAITGINGAGTNYQPSIVPLHQPLVNSLQQTAPCVGCCRILWDSTHGESGSDGFVQYGTLVADLQAKGYTVTTTTAGVDTIDLSDYDVLVINAGSAINSAYTTPEVDAIEAFVNNGGGLLVMDEWASFHAANLEPVVNRFGTNNAGTIGSWDIITNIDGTQPIFSGITSLKMFYIGKLTATPPSFAVAWDGADAVANMVTGKKVVILADGNIFQDQEDFINTNDNRKFATNVFDYLCPKKTNVPEFPTMALPITLIIGFVGVVFFIQRRRQD